MSSNSDPGNSPVRSKGPSVPVALVTDDSEIDREVMVDLLRSAGFDAYGLPSPIGATRAAREKGASVVVVDQNLPAMDGSKLTGIFRSSASLRAIREAMVSGSEVEEMVDIARWAQAGAFVGKSRLDADLLPTVKRLLSR